MNQSGGLETRTQSTTRTLTGIALFTAIAVILNTSPLKFPAPYAPFLFYELWEIPIIAALLIYGLYASFTVALLNTMILLVAFQGALAAGPLYNFIAVLATLVAVSLTYKFGSSFRAKTATIVLFATGLAIALRVAVMTIVNFELLPFPAPIGFSIPQSATIPILPLIALFNATVVLYSVPVAYLVYRTAFSRLRSKTAYALG